MMRWFFWGRPLRDSGKDDYLDDDIEYRRKLLIRSRHMGYIDSDLSDLESPFGAPSNPFSELLQSNDENVPDEILSLVREGSGIQELVDAYPEDVISVLKHHAVVKLGTFQATDSEVLKAFGQNSMLTRGCQTLHDEEWKENWMERIKTRANTATRFVSVGWEEMVCLGAYAVNIKNIAARDRGALLQLLLMKHFSGATSKKIWDFPAVRAVINYHWEHWAKRFLIAATVLFLGWLCSFTTYLAIYIVCLCDSKTEEETLRCPVSQEAEAESHHSGIGDEGSLARVATYILNILAFVFMCPFALMEYWTIIKQGWRWIQPRNVLDICAILLQTFIFVCHMLQWRLDDEWFGTVLAFQCVFLFSKLQNFGRTLGTGASISEIFVSVIYDVRYLLVYIFFTGISASLCLGAIYKHDEKFQDDANVGYHFSSFKNSLVTTFQIIFGSFDTAYIFQAKHAWVKIFFFFGFQVLMTITVLNLLIAVMTESYSKFAAEQRILYNRGRASAIDELDVLRIPSFFADELHPYIHFLVIEKKTRVTPSNGRPSARPSLQPNEFAFPAPEPTDDLRKKIDELTAQVNSLVQLVRSQQNTWTSGAEISPV